MHPGGPRAPARGRPSTPTRLALVAIVVLGGCRSAAGGPPPDAGTGTVVEVIDGDTVDVRLAGRVERVRLIGVDTPETVARDRPVQCFGAEASAAAKDLLPLGTEVRLERDDVTRDRYGRLLAYVWRTADDVLVNLALIEGGFADAVSYGDNESLRDILAAAEAAARSGGVGLWSACGGPDVPLATSASRP